MVHRTATRLNCGIRKPKFDEDYSGNIWGGNKFWSPVRSFAKNACFRIFTVNAITKTSTSPNFYPGQLYQIAKKVTNTCRLIKLSMIKIWGGRCICVSIHSK